VQEISGKSEGSGDSLRKDGDSGFDEQQTAFETAEIGETAFTTCAVGSY
jgi:hypothetical protein